MIHPKVSGRRSKACLPCRMKRRRCDFRQPSCTQCDRAHVTCTGYRDAGSLLFRDETAYVSRRAQLINAEKLAARAKELAHSKAQQLHNKNQGNDFPQPLCLSPDLESIAVSYYFNIHVTNTPFSYLPQIWPAIGSSKMIRAATVASSLACLERVVQHPDIMVLARRHYSTALLATNRALQNRDCATQDTTLLSIILLSTFEALTFRRRASRESWSVHIHGLLALLASRGEHQFLDRCGQRLFGHAALYILTHCAQLKIPVPKQLDRLQSYAYNVLGPNHFPSRIGRLLTGMATLRVTMRDAPATQVVRMALDLDDGFLKILQSMPTMIQSVGLLSQAYLPDAPAYHDETCHYTSLEDLRRRNALRVFRISLQEWIFCACETGLHGVIVDGPSPMDPLYQDWHYLRMRAVFQFEKLAGDILASLPYVKTFQIESSHASARFLLWPLISIATSELCSISLRESVLDTLRTISTTYNMKQAQEALDMLDEGSRMEGWLLLLQFS